MTTITPSRILDEDTVTTNHNHPTCTAQNGKTSTPEPSRGACGKPAVVEVIRTCCDAPGIIYWCASHLTENTILSPIGCVQCRHRCNPGVCLHRIINPI